MQLYAASLTKFPKVIYLAPSKELLFPPLEKSESSQPTVDTKRIHVMLYGCGSAIVLIDTIQVSHGFLLFLFFLDPPPCREGRYNFGVWSPHKI